MLIHLSVDGAGQSNPHRSTRQWRERNSFLAVVNQRPYPGAVIA